MFFSWTSRERSEDANSNGETTGNGQPHEPDSHQSAGRYYSRLSLTLATAFCIVATEPGFDVILMQTRLIIHSVLYMLYPAKTADL